MLDEGLCEHCQKQRATMFGIDCPVSLLIGQKIKWNFCQPCYRRNLDYAQIVRRKAKDDPELGAFVEDLKQVNLKGSK